MTPPRVPGFARELQAAQARLPRRPRRGRLSSSARLVKGADGREYKPEDYRQAFARFVKENPLPIEAIRILLNRPQDWSTDALGELKQKLAITRERFTLDNLEKAHAAYYHKNLVDVISMVKRAAKE